MFLTQGLEGACPNVKCDKGKPHSRLFDTSEQILIEVQSRCRGCDGTVVFGVHGLVAIDIVRLDLSIQVRRQRDIAILFKERADWLRIKADRFLYGIYLILITAVGFVIFAGQLTRFDVAARSSAERDLITIQAEAIATRARDIAKAALAKGRMVSYKWFLILH